MKGRSTQPELNRQVLEEASTWFVDFRVGDADAVTRARFDQWLRQSPEHIRAYMEIARTYVELPALRSNQKLDNDALIASARADTNVLPLREAVAMPQAVARVGRRSPIWSRALAATVAIGALGLSLMTWYDAHQHPTYSTEIGENRSITLADGSTVDLNARSKLRIRFSKAERQVELLDGQALFEVRHDAQRPFIVRSGGTLVRAVGTQFDVYRGSGGTTVTVLEGRVAVADAVRARDPSRAIVVSAGEQVTVTAQVITRPKVTNVATATAWTQHRLIFDATPLSEVVDDFNRYNARQLIIEDRELADFHVSGVYTSTDPASLIRFLREQPGVEVAETADAVHIHRK